jgi:internalin A
MADQPSIFVSYAHADTRWLNELDPHLNGLSLHAKVERFDDRQLFGGDDWNAEVKAALDRADIILLLVTANFIGSEYIHRVELPAALKRRQEDGSVVVPVLVQDCARKLLAIDDINYLPKDPSGALKPLARWRAARRGTAVSAKSLSISFCKSSVIEGVPSAT